MAKSTQIDTSCIALFADNTTKKYKSLEDASKNTGISVAAIKIRCNKPGTSGKDGISFKWANEHTARHFMAKKNRRKGGSLETEVVNSLKKIGYKGVCRAAGESKNLDNKKVDIADTNNELEFAIQCKHYTNFPNYFNIKKDCKDNRDFVLIWKKSAQAGENSKGTVAVMDVDTFYKLLKIYHKDKNNKK